MQRLLIWLIALSSVLGAAMSVMIMGLIWLWLGHRQIEFEINFIEACMLFASLSFMLLIGLCFVFYYSLNDLKKLLSENPFSDIYSSAFSHFNPLLSIRKMVKKNNERGHAELEKMRSLEQHRKDYIGNVSHELKTPIFNIQGYLSSLLDGALEDKKVNRNFLEKADKNVDRMINIVMDLQTISRFEAGELQLQNERFGIYQLIEDVIESEKEMADKNHIIFDLYAGDEIEVEADKFRIRQVLTNLMVNSIKYGKPEGGKTTIRVYDLDKSIKLEIADNGIGMDEKHLSRIFERFYRVDSSRSREKGGSGLGLAIVKHIIEAHGESIEVMSTPGAGTVFSFSLSKSEEET